MPRKATLFQPYCRRVDRGALAPALCLRQPSEAAAVGQRAERQPRDLGSRHCNRPRLQHHGMTERKSKRTRLNTSGVAITAGGAPP